MNLKIIKIVIKKIKKKKVIKKKKKIKTEKIVILLN